jgi:hypothetical protein
MRITGTEARMALLRYRRWKTLKDSKRFVFAELKGRRQQHKDDCEIYTKGVKQEAA